MNIKLSISTRDSTSARYAIVKVKQRSQKRPSDGWPKMYCVELDLVYMNHLFAFSDDFDTLFILSLILAIKRSM
jgi:hypothetical protein